MIQRIRELMDRSPVQAVQAFSQFLAISGLRRRSEGRRLEKPPVEEWIRIAGTDAARDLSSWLPRLLDMCEQAGMTSSSSADGAGRLEDFFRTGLPDDVCLILTAQAADRRMRLFKIISEKAGF
jgi:hypothetical protein